jgi:hypothetical protein
MPPEELDNKTLLNQLKNIAKTLWEVHSHTPKSYRYVEWAHKSRTNYLKLVDMGIKVCLEIEYRTRDKQFKSPEYTNKKVVLHNFFYWDFQNICKYQNVLEFALDNIPNLPDIAETPSFPLDLPEEYIEESLISSDPNDSHYDVYGSTPEDIIDSYRNYYLNNLPKDATWTRRKKPNYLN